jgi:hypothetical protein
MAYSKKTSQSPINQLHSNSIDLYNIEGKLIGSTVYNPVNLRFYPTVFFLQKPNFSVNTITKKLGIFAIVWFA